MIYLLLLFDVIICCCVFDYFMDIFCISAMLGLEMFKTPGNIGHNAEKKVMQDWFS